MQQPYKYAAQLVMKTEQVKEAEVDATKACCCGLKCTIIQVLYLQRKICFL